VINVVNGAGGEIAQRLITHPACAKVSFTGSVAGFQNAVDHRLRRQIIQEQRGVFAPQLKGHPFT
jgi:acyl-CoA reductase-like NAD-dependent aldehyde dehydrogenase